jgi:hypothetical protein
MLGRNTMTQHVYSTPAHRSKDDSKRVKRTRSNERKRTTRNNQRHAERPKKTLAFKSSATLVVRSEEMLKGLLEHYGAEWTDRDVIKDVLKAKLGDKLRRMQRKHRQKALAVASALYHIIFDKTDPAAALEKLVKEMNVTPPRGSDPCRAIVECLFDYGGTKEERTYNRQYACSDANALRYIIRKGIEPQKVLKPEGGQSITQWAKREAQYRKPENTSDAGLKAAEVGNSRRSKSAGWKLPVMLASEQRYRALQGWAKKGVFLVEPEDDGRPLVVTVTELSSLTVDEAKFQPEKVRGNSKGLRQGKSKDS